jgi:hypothetical protein
VVGVLTVFPELDEKIDEKEEEEFEGVERIDE